MMKKHGLILLALTCWSAGAMFAADSGIPASTGMPGGGPVALTSEELEAIEGGDLLLSVDRDTQMMTVTRITPGRYDDIECYSVKVTTSVTRNMDMTDNNPKGAMANTERKLVHGDSDLIPMFESRTPTQFPAGTSKLSPVVGTQEKVTGQVIRTNAAQDVAGTDAKSQPGMFKDSGYNIHYVDPAKATNTFGCIGVQSQAGMERLISSLKADNASYAKPSDAKQIVTVTAYTNNTPPPPSTFRAVEVKAPTPPVVSKPVPAVVSKPSAPYPVVAAASKPWWKLW